MGQRFPASGKLFSALGRGRAAKTFRMPLKILECPEDPSSIPYLFQVLSLSEVAQPLPQGEGHKGQPMEPTVCIFPLGLVLQQGRSQDRNFQREEARPEKDSDKSKARDCPPDSECPKDRDHLY